MHLVDLVDNSLTDKNTTHSYLDLYNTILFSKKNTAMNVLEVGINTGGSIKLWRDYFKIATVYGLDISHISHVCDDLKNDERIVLLTSVDAYNYDYFKSQFLDKNIKCDFMLDDGPHTLESMIQFIKLYSQIMTDDGVLIIEDVPDINWLETLASEVPENLKKYIKVYDLRQAKGRYDDIVFTIDRSNV